MAKFPIGSTVKYSGSNNALRLHFGTGMKVVDVIPEIGRASCRERV